MELGNWQELENKLQSKIKEIFKDYELDELSNYQKREIIFDYLYNTLSYNYELLEKIKTSKKREGTRLVREPFLELKDVIDTNIGICNSISQYYKLLLEQLDIKAYCVICDDGTSVKHEIVLVYDEDSDIYSFDDITSVIVKRGNKDTFFDYDVEVANRENQGTKEILEDNKFVVLDEDYIDMIVGRKIGKYQIKRELPSNVGRVKKNYHM